MKPHFTIQHNGVVYLKRWHILPRNRFLNLYLHKFEHDDDDRALHDHPWHSLSLPIIGGYWDVRRGGAMFRCKPWRFVYRRATHAHRVVLHRNADGSQRVAWSLFLTGPRIREWGFLCPQGWRSWREYAAPGDKGKIGKGCGE